MPDWLYDTLRLGLGLGLIGAIFWFAFRRPPDPRNDGSAMSNDPPI